LREKDDVRERNREWRADINNLASVMISRSRKRAAKKGLEFDLDKEWLQEKLDFGRCEITNIPFVFDRKAKAPFAPSIDRRDSSQGYLRTNCNLVSWIYNGAKNHHDHSDVLRMAQALCTQS
tara:strand:+ start:91 stop:456 length:366 start_codon:yes stop_codon:yes gene_type:complete